MRDEGWEFRVRQAGLGSRQTFLGCVASGLVPKHRGSRGSRLDSHHGGSIYN